MTDQVRAPNSGRFEITIATDELSHEDRQGLEDRIAKLSDAYMVVDGIRIREGVREDTITFQFDTDVSFDIGPTVRAIATGAAKVSQRPAYVAWAAVSGERFRP